MSKAKGLIALTISAALLISATSIYIMGLPTNNAEITNNIIWKNEYADDRVIVVLNNEASLFSLNNEKQDFLDISCKSILDLSYDVGIIVKKAMNNISRHVLNGDRIEPYNSVELGKFNRILCVKLLTPGEENVIAAIKQLRKNDNVLYAGPDYPLDLCKIPNDPNQFYGIFDANKYYDPIDLQEAWDITTGSGSVKVGIIDTGIYGGHPDLSNNINATLSRDFSSNGSIQSALTDNNGHGTSVAGIVGAIGNNAIGAFGVCWDVDLISLRAVCLDSSTNEDKLYASGAIQAISYAEYNGIKILNMSASINQDYPDMLEAIEQYSGLFVCSSGNNLINVDLFANYPGRYRLTNMIVVGAVDAVRDIYISSNPSYGSNYGKLTVDIFAPTLIYTTDITEEAYRRFSGTSASAPVISGVAALMLSVNPDLSPMELKSIIMDTVTEVSNLSDLCYSGGVVNAYKAVHTALMCDSTAPITYSSISSTSHNISYKNCGDCPHCDNIESPEASGECEDCANGCWITYSVKHSLRTVDYDSSSHYVECSECNYIATNQSHDIGYIATGTGHTSECRICAYSANEIAHLWSYTKTSSLFTHSATCIMCGYEFEQSHTWVASSLGYGCSACGKISDSVPGIMSLTYDELASYLAMLSDEERDDFIVSLLEDQLEQITMLPPPKNGDEPLAE